jgi:hypothetical protein
LTLADFFPHTGYNYGTDGGALYVDGVLMVANQIGWFLDYVRDALAMANNALEQYDVSVEVESGGSCPQATNLYPSDFVGPLPTGSARLPEDWSPITGPPDPRDPSQPLYDAMEEHLDRSFMDTSNGTARNGLAEAGFIMNYANGYLFPALFQNTVHSSGPPNRMTFPTLPSTIAIGHTHGNRGVEEPSIVDCNSIVPNYLRSRGRNYVTIPGTGHYMRLP